MFWNLPKTNDTHIISPSWYTVLPTHLHTYTADLMMLRTWHVINYTLHTAWCVGIRLIVLCPVMCSVCCILLFHHLLLLFQCTTRSPKSAICVVACLIVSCCHLVMSFPNVMWLMSWDRPVMSCLCAPWSSHDRQWKLPKLQCSSICHRIFCYFLLVFIFLFLFVEWNLLLLIVKTVFEYAYF